MPVSLIKMQKWLTARKVDLADHVRDMEEKPAVVGEAGLVEGDEEQDLEMGAVLDLDVSEDEEEGQDEFGDSDSE